MNPKHILGETECLRLLAEAGLGRLVFTERALPSMRPVRYRLAGHVITVDADVDGPLAKVVTGTVVAFTADDLRGPGCTGWSVVALGRASLHDGVLRVDIELISGRKF
ncbi:hypothetical protein JOF53_007246 [Crossiella equi]|uniref:Pyridoxamine 5'-phosphate oxidase n=1 Tax=Crossiella equi TaxID=130796 RepID=A0ABS5AQ79_9PSEU|nr:pyridoxamine 5'-phosphate oxidase family protein [Crossiella equi]MBP2478374.1 hypothetical protein [Crossiella equi]